MTPKLLVCLDLYPSTIQHNLYKRRKNHTLVAWEREIVPLAHIFGVVDGLIQTASRIASNTVTGKPYRVIPDRSVTWKQADWPVPADPSAPTD